MPQTTNLTAFQINNIANTGTRFLLEVTLFYNYNIGDQTYSNSEINSFNIPIEEFNMFQIYDAVLGGISCELNSINKCMFRYSNDMYDIDNNYSTPDILYGYIVQNIL